MSMKDFKEFVELEEGLKPEHNMRPGWMIKADPVLKAKIAANKAKQKEMKALLGQKLKEEEQIDELSKETLKSYVDKVSTTEPRGKTPTGVLKSIKAIGGVTKAIRKQYSSK